MTFYWFLGFSQNTKEFGENWEKILAIFILNNFLYTFYKNYNDTSLKYSI